MTYAAAIPIRENTRTGTELSRRGTSRRRPDPRPRTSTTTSAPRRTTSSRSLNGAIVAGTYEAPSKPGKVGVRRGHVCCARPRTSRSRSSNDLALLDQGDMTKWTMNVQMSEYRLATTSSSTTCVPNGLCPLGTIELRASRTTRSESATRSRKTAERQLHVRRRAGATAPTTSSGTRSTFPGSAHRASDTCQLSFWTAHPRRLPVELTRRDSDAVEGRVTTTSTSRATT